MNFCVIIISKKGVRYHDLSLIEVEKGGIYSIEGKIIIYEFVCIYEY
jgi:hypothetical protein